MIRVIGVIVLSVVMLAGCAQSGTPKVEVVKAPEADPIAEVKAMLTNYANGQPVTSEAEEYGPLAERVKAKDAVKGEVIAKGLNEIKANPASAQAKAKELLKKL